MSKCPALLFVLLSFYQYGDAQTPYRYFNRLSVQNGLSNEKVNCMLQDKRGFIWIGTNDGLNRYDGNYFTIFRSEPGSTATLSGNIITCLLEDEQGLIWIGTSDGGLTRYNYKLPASEQFKQFKHIPDDSTSIPVNIINSLLQDDAGNLWLGTSGKSALVFNKKTGQFLAPVNTGAGTVLSMCKAGPRQLWMGKQGGGILKMDPTSLSFQTDKRYNDLYAKLPHATVTALYRDQHQDIWFGSWDKMLYRYNATSGKEEIFKSNPADQYSFQDDEALCFAEDVYGNLWIGGRNKGLHVYNAQSRSFYNYRNDPSKEGTIANNSVNSMFIDKKGLVWIGTDKGISIYNPRQQSFEQTFLPAEQSNVIIYDFFEPGGDSLLIGTSDGIYVQDKNALQITHHPLKYQEQSLAVSRFFRDERGSVFIGTNYSLFAFDPKSFAIRLLPGTEKDAVMNKIIESRVVSVVSDSIDGRPVLLVAPYGHYVAYYDVKAERWVSRTDTVRKIVRQFNLKDNLIRKLFRSSSGAIWMATAKAGLGEWQNTPTPFVKYYDNNPRVSGTLSNNNVFDIAEDAMGNLWVSTFGGGLNYYNRLTGKFNHFPESSNLLEGLQTDVKGNVWMITNGNLQKYNQATKSFSSYMIPDIDKSGGIKGYLYKAANGEFYAAGNGYFIHFNPALVQDLNVPPKMMFTDFKIFNKSYNELLLNNLISLQYDQNYFTIEFSAPDYLSGKAHYRYKLEGYNKEWIDAGSTNAVNFSNLKSGDYIFSVRGTYKTGDWGNRDLQLHLRIVPPIWQRWWFYVFCAALIIATTLLVYRYRINELLKRQAIRDKIAQDLHDSVGSTLSSISIYSQVAEIYNEQHKQHELNNALTKISEASAELINELSDTVWAINPRNDNMETILLRMESFARPLLAAAGIQLHFDIEQGVENRLFGMTTRKNFYLIFKEAVNNAVKYSHCRNLFVYINYRDGLLHLTVKDDGIGFENSLVKLQSKHSLSGNGLHNMKRRAREIKGEYDISSAAGKGTVIELHFPVT